MTFYCNRSNQKVEPSNNKKYSFECLNCDEDLYLAEVHTKAKCCDCGNENIQVGDKLIDKCEKCNSDNLMDL